MENASGELEEVAQVTRKNSKKKQKKYVRKTKKIHGHRWCKKKGERYKKKKAQDMKLDDTTEQTTPTEDMQPSLQQMETPIEESLYCLDMKFVEEENVKNSVNNSRKKQKPKKIKGDRSCKKKGENKKEIKADVTQETKSDDTTQMEDVELSLPPLKRLNQLISKKQRRQIESLYYLDMTLVDEEKVKNTISIDDKNYRCTLCDTAYVRLDKCQIHVWRHYSMLPYVCRACGFKTLTVSMVRGHVRMSHLRLKPFKCNHCDKSFTAASLLKEHMATHWRTEPYRCDNCNFTCMNKRVLVSHMTKHKTEKDVFCNICNKAFYSTKKMRDHRNTHKESNAVQCNICLAYVTSESALRRHHDNVHSKQHACKICGKKFAMRKAMHNHVYQVHSEGKHKCPICPNVYKNSSMLQDHILKHQGIRKYKCEVCGKAFAQRSHIATHMAVHDKKRFACPGCNKMFNRQDNMKTHAKNCAIFLADPKLAKLLSTKRWKYKLLSTQNDPDMNVKVEPVDEEAIEPMDVVSIEHTTEAE